MLLPPCALQRETIHVATWAPKGARENAARETYAVSPCAHPPRILRLILAVSPGTPSEKSLSPFQEALNFLDADPLWLFGIAAGRAQRTGGFSGPSGEGRSFVGEKHFGLDIWQRGSGRIFLFNCVC